MPQLYEDLEGWNFVCDRGLQLLKGIKGNIFSYYFSLLLELISWHDAYRPHGGRKGNVYVIHNNNDINNNNNKIINFALIVIIYFLK